MSSQQRFDHCKCMKNDSAKTMDNQQAVKSGVSDTDETGEDDTPHLDYFGPDVYSFVFGN